MSEGPVATPGAGGGGRTVPAEAPRPEVIAEIERLLGLVRDRYGARLGAAELEEVRRTVEGIVEAAHTLRAVRLGNSDEPFPPFVPVRTDG
jgi:hypothetical protein